VAAHRRCWAVRQNRGGLDTREPSNGVSCSASVGRIVEERRHGNCYKVKESRFVDSWYFRSVLTRPPGHSVRGIHQAARSTGRSSRLPCRSPLGLRPRVLGTAAARRAGYCWRCCALVPGGAAAVPRCAPCRKCRPLRACSRRARRPRMGRSRLVFLAKYRLDRREGVTHGIVGRLDGLSQPLDLTV